MTDVFDPDSGAGAGGSLPDPVPYTPVAGDDPHNTDADGRLRLAVYVAGASDALTLRDGAGTIFYEGLGLGVATGSAPVTAWAWDLSDVPPGVYGGWAACTGDAALSVAVGATVALYGPAATAFFKRRLGQFAAALSDPDVNAEMTDAAVAIVTQFPCIGVYSGLSATDRHSFDIAVGLRAAMSLLSPGSSASGNGLSKLKTSDLTSDFEYTFALPDPTERDRWAAEMTGAVGSISCVRAGNVAQSSRVSMFGVAGRSRSRAASPCYQSRVFALLPCGWR